MQINNEYYFNGVKTQLRRFGKELMLFRYNYAGDKLGQVVAKKTVNRKPIYDAKTRLHYNKEIYKENYIYQDLGPTKTFIRFLTDKKNQYIGKWVEIKDDIAGHLSFIKDKDGKIIKIMDDIMAKDKISYRRTKLMPAVAQKYIGEVRKFLGLENNI